MCIHGPDVVQTGSGPRATSLIHPALVLVNEVLIRYKVWLLTVVLKPKTRFVL